MSERSGVVLWLLGRAGGYRDPNPERGHITGQEHALRLAGFDWQSDEDRFVALIHDLARPLNDVFHGEVIAWMVRDRVGPDAFAVLHTHGQFQADVSGAALRFSSRRWLPAALLLAHREEATFELRWDRPGMALEDAAGLIRRTLD